MKHRVQSAPLVTAVVPALTALSLALAACAGPPVTTPIVGEPVCPDLELGGGRTKMIGGLRYPVQLTIKSGSSVAFKATLVGLRTSKDLASRILLADDDAKLTVEWGQCENERAPKAATPTAGPAMEIAPYECGNATVYKTEELTTKKGDPTSHKLTFVAPPNPACWQSTAATEPADAGAPDASPAAADAGTAADPDAGTTDADSGAADAGTADADGGAVDAGTTGAGGGAADAGTTGAGDAGKDAATPR